MWGNHPLSQRNKAKKCGGSRGFLGGGQFENGGARQYRGVFIK